MHKSLVIGITGGIGSGKSVAAAELKRLGVRVIDCDVLARELQQRGCAGAIRIREEFGSQFFDDGELNREKLRNEVFLNSSSLLRLNSIMLPLVVERVKEELKDAREQGVRAVAVDAPLLFEAGLEQIVDRVWAVSAQQHLRERRVIERSGTEAGTVRNIIASQMSDEQRQARAHFVLQNNGTMEQFIQDVRQAAKDEGII